MIAYVILSGIGTTLFIPGAYCVLKGMLFTKNPVLAQYGRGFMAAASFFLFIADVLTANYLGISINGLLGAYWGYTWWKNRNKGGWENALRHYGEKTKDKIKEMVDNITPSPVPLPR